MEAMRNDEEWASDSGENDMKGMKSRAEELLSAVEKMTGKQWSKPLEDTYPGDEGWWMHDGEGGDREFAIGATLPHFNKNARNDAFAIVALRNLAPQLIADQQAEIARLHDALADMDR